MEHNMEEVLVDGDLEIEILGFDREGGGVEGARCRPCHPNWVRSIRDQCQAAGVPIFIKTFQVNGKISNLMDEWPEDVRIRRQTPDGH